MSFFTNLFIMLLFPILATGSYSTTFTIINKCSSTVFPGIFYGAGTSLPSTTGFALPPGESNVITVHGSSSGSLWGRTCCSYDSNGKFSCLTGDCASSTVECDGGNASPPATVAEFNLNATSTGSDFFRVSDVNGYNLPMMVEPQVGNGVGDCMTTSCMMHLNKICPPELKVMSGGDCIGCRSACKPLSKYCNSEFFTKACPQKISVVKRLKEISAVKRLKESDLVVTHPGSYSTTFTIINKCSSTVFPGIFYEAGTSLPSTTGFALPPGESNVITVHRSWSGSLWGRTRCSYDSNGKFSCLTGDCASSTVECDGGNASPPATLAEFNLNATSTGSDFFRVSVMNGYNLPMMVEPQVGNGVGDCMTTSCMVHLNKICPPELKVMSGGDCIGCRSACKPFSKYCCSEFFTKACPHANVDATKTFQSVCESTDYLITFCPIYTSSDQPRKKKNPTKVDNSRGQKKRESTSNNKLLAWFKKHLVVVLSVVIAAAAVGIAVLITIVCCNNCCNNCCNGKPESSSSSHNLSIKNKFPGLSSTSDSKLLDNVIGC